MADTDHASEGVHIEVASAGLTPLASSRAPETNAPPAAFPGSTYFQADRTAVTIPANKPNSLDAGILLRTQNALNVLRGAVIGLVCVCIALIIALAWVGARLTLVVEPRMDDVRTFLQTTAAAGGSVLTATQIAPTGFVSQGNLFRGTGFWAPRKSLPAGRSDFMAQAYGDGYVFLLGGTDSTGNALKNVTKYDAILHTYTALPAMKLARTRVQSVSMIGDVVYMVGGYQDGGATLNPCVEAYNVTAASLGLATYSTLLPATCASGGAGALLTPRSDHCAVAVGTKIIITGGYSANYDILDKTEVYETAGGAWTAVNTAAAAMSTPRGDLQCAVVNGLVYAVGGYYSPTFMPRAFLTSVESYDVSANKWTSRASTPHAHSDGVLVVLPGARLLVASGETDSRNLRTGVPTHFASLYYTAQDAWVEKAMMPTERFRGAGAFTNDMVVVFGGQSIADDPNAPAPQNYLTSVEAYFDLRHPQMYLNSRAGATPPPPPACAAGVVSDFC